jgi:hypothetical protein
MARALGKLCKDAAGWRRKRNVVCADNLVRKLEKRFLGIQSVTCYKEELKGAIEIGINLRPLACNSHTMLFTSLRVSSLAFFPPFETHESMVYGVFLGGKWSKCQNSKVPSVYQPRGLTGPEITLEILKVKYLNL